MTGAPAEHRFYRDLPAWWPLISPVADYVEEAAFIGSLFARASIPVREVLESGSGGGHNADHLAERFTMTLVDLSAEMLAVSRRLNPGCAHVVADMRDVALGRAFDAVLVHDAVDYMTSEADLCSAVASAFAHCRPGGLAVFVPDDTAETFVASSDHGGSDGDDGRAAPIVVSSIGLGISVLAGFLWWELRATAPMLPLRFFRSRAFAATNGVSFAMFFGVFGSIFLLSQFFRTAQGYSPFEAGLRTLPWTGMPMLVAPLAGALSEDGRLLEPDRPTRDGRDGHGAGLRPFGERGPRASAPRRPARRQARRTRSASSAG